jgi:hypothetical protein
MVVRTQNAADEGLEADAHSEDWSRELDENFLGWILPSACRQSIDPQVAARFLSRLSGRADHLELLRASSLFVAHEEELRQFVEVDLPELVRVLPAQTRVEHRVWEGGFHGRLDIQRTLQLHHAAQPTRFVTRARKRDFGLPENVLVRTVVDRLIEELERVVSAQGSGGWLRSMAERATQLKSTLLGSVLWEVVPEPVRGRHLRAAARARLPAYSLAAWWFHRLQEAFDADATRTAALLARGALRPLTREKRFELAVLGRLIYAVSIHLRSSSLPGRWTVNHAVLMKNRDEVVTFCRDDGAVISVWYDFAKLPGSERLEGLRHYLGTGAAQRPDVSICRRHPDGRENWVVIEIKCSSRLAYLASGYDEARQYHAEYRAYLGGWPQSILVTSSDIPGAARPSDPVVVIDWRRWVPPEVVAGLVDGLE